MVLFYIEAGTYIDEDEKWETMLSYVQFLNVYCYVYRFMISHLSLLLFRFEKKRIGDKYIYSLIGFCTMYNYYFYNREKNISTENHIITNKAPDVNEGKVIPEDIRLRIR